MARVAACPLNEGEQNTPMTEYVATRWYRAPEVILSWKHYNRTIDMWSVGCIFAELLGRKPLFQGSNYMDQITTIIDIIALDLLSRMLAFNPEKRIPVQDALAHPYLAALHDPSEEPATHPFYFDFENESLTEEGYRDLIYQEALVFQSRNPLRM